MGNGVDENWKNRAPVAQAGARRPGAGPLHRIESRHAPAMRALRLGTHGLPSAEAGLVRALVRLFASGESSTFAWSFADAPPYDAVVIEDTGAGLPQAMAEAAVVRLAPPGGPPSDGVLARPIQIDLLQAWLLKVQLELDDCHMAAADDGTVPMPLAPAGSWPVAASPDRGGRGEARYKLRRWPPSELLRNDPARIRMATLLSKRPLGLGEMADLAVQPVERCTSFVNLLTSFGLLDRHDDTGPHPRATASSAAMPPPLPAQSRQDSRWRLVRGIRQRLGL